MIKLPRWLLPSSVPSVYDTDSKTVIEQTAKVYGAMRQLIEEYNAFSETMENAFNENNSANAAEIQNFKKSVEQRLRCQFEKMDAAFQKLAMEVNHIDRNVIQVTTDIVNQAIVDGKITVAINYNPDTEEVEILTGGET
jgi:uncharacterized protein YdcH (DUF465 family)